MSRRKMIENILLWGSLWGLEEATLGHFLHLFGVRIGWIFWFPLAYFFMHQVYHKTNRAGAVLYTALLAAVFKLVDLLLPTRLDMVVSPAAAILLEGCAVFALFWMVEKRPFLARFSFLQVLGVSLLQGLLCLAYVFITSSLTPVIPPIKGVASCLTSLLHCLMNGIIISVFWEIYKKAINFLPIKYCLSAFTKLKWPAPNKGAAAFCPYLLFAFTVYATWVM